MLTGEERILINETIGGTEVDDIRRKDGWLCLGFTELNLSSVFRVFSTQKIHIFFFNNDCSVHKKYDVDGIDISDLIEENKYIGNVIVLSDDFYSYYEIIEGVGILMCNEKKAGAVEGAFDGAVSTALSYFNAEIASIEKLGGHGVEYAESMRKLVNWR